MPIVLTEATLAAIILAFEGLSKLIPIIAEGIEGLNLPEQTKEEYKARIKAAQASLPEWV